MTIHFTLGRKAKYNAPQAQSVTRAGHCRLTESVIMDWFTADTHFGHGNILKYCGRPHLTPEEKEMAAKDRWGRWKVSVSTVEAHDADLLQKINDRVKTDDRLFIIGDFCWGGHDHAKKYLGRINCKRVILVQGNHDKPAIFPLFSEVMVEGTVNSMGQDIFLHHRPQRSWYGSFDGAWHLYGHVHRNMQWEDDAENWMLTKDVGVDACDYVPLNYHDIAAYMAPRLPKFKERKKAVTGGEKLRFTW